MPRVTATPSDTATPAYDHGPAQKNPAPARNPFDQIRRQPTAFHTASHQTQDVHLRSSQPVHLPDAGELTWRPPSSLDAPPPRPGYVQRWVRFNDKDHQDTNWSLRYREGWRPRPPESVPESFAFYPNAPGADGQNMIRVGHLVLCELPVQLALQRRQSKLELTRRQSQGTAEAAEGAAREFARVNNGEGLRVTDQRTVSGGARQHRRSGPDDFLN